MNGVVQAAVGGQAVTQVLDGERRFDVVVRFLPQYRESIESISNIPVSTPDGERIPLKQVAEIVKQTGASFIYREDNARYIPVKFSVRGPRSAKHDRGRLKGNSQRKSSFLRDTTTNGQVNSRNCRPPWPDSKLLCRSAY